MTYVEFFDEVASENICACLTFIPDRVILIGDDSKRMNKHIAYYEKAFEKRFEGKSIQFIAKSSPRNNLNKVVDILETILRTYDDCVFDVTGGDEAYILALGILKANHPEQSIQIHKMNFSNNTLYDYDMDGKTIFKDAPVLSVKENIRIYGGDIVFGGVDEKKTYDWKLTPDFLNDLDQIWTICKNNVRLWNAQIGVMNAAEEVGTQSEDKLTTVVSRAALDHYLSQVNARYLNIRSIIGRLLNERLLTRFEEDEGTLTISYKNHQVKRCLTTAGMALEMKVFITAKSTVGAGGALVYNDALNGVLLDWDGEMHDEEVEQVYDTENEIDVMLMRGMIPVFISCKNGIVYPEELYKLNTVANRFGARYAKKVLVATSIPNNKTGEYFRQRAVDMGILLIENVQNIDDEELAVKLANI